MSTKRQPRVGEPMARMDVKVPASVLAAAKERAARDGETLSAAVVRLLRKYAR